MRRFLNRIFGRRTTAAPAEPNPYAPVWTTGALPEVEPLLKRGVR